MLVVCGRRPTRRLFRLTGLALTSSPDSYVSSSRAAHTEASSRCGPALTRWLLGLGIMATLALVGYEVLMVIIRSASGTGNREGDGRRQISDLRAVEALNLRGNKRSD